MGNWYVSLAIGAGLVTFGGFLLWMHRRAWIAHDEDPALDDVDRTYYRDQYRRRMQTSGLILLLGILIPVGDLPAVWRALGPLASTIYWISVLLVTMWVVLLGVGDFLSIRAHARVELARIRRKQQQLRKELADLQRGNSDGHHQPSSN